MQWQSRLLLSSVLNWILLILLIKISDSKQIIILVRKGNDMPLSVCQYNTQIYLIYVWHSNLLALRSTIVTAGTCSRDWAVHVKHLSPKLKNDVMKNKQRFPRTLLSFHHHHCQYLSFSIAHSQNEPTWWEGGKNWQAAMDGLKIGRASCRERV